MTGRNYVFYLLFSSGLAYLPIRGVAQIEEITWQQLSDVVFEDVWNDNAGMTFLKPQFGSVVQRLEGKTLAISGYMIPVDISLDYYVLSAFPFASCFFCGGAGPESVLDLNFTEKQSYKNDERAKVCGTLRLNKTDLYSLPYALDNVRPCP